MVKEKRILSYFIGWLVLGFIVCFIGIKNTYALVINSSYLGQNVNTNFGITANSYKQGTSSITVDSINALNYYVVDICTTLNNSFNISNVSNQSGSVSFFKAIPNLGSCNTTNYTGTLAKIYFKVNEWADAGNGNYGVIFSSRLNSTANYYGDTRILNIYTSNDTDNTGEIINNQTNILNNSINNSTNTITGSITDSQNNINSNIQSSQENITNSITDTENNINSNIDDMEQSIVDSNKVTQDVIKDQFNSCRPSVNIASVTSSTSYNFTIGTVNSGKNYTLSFNSNSVISFHIKGDGEILTSRHNFTGYFKYTFQSSGEISITFNSWGDIAPNITEIQLQEGTIATAFEEPGQICTNKLDEQNETQKGIWGSLKSGISSIGNWFTELGDKIGTFFDNLLQGIIDGLKSLFIPEDGYFENWFNSLKSFFEIKLGFLATPFTLIIDFVSRYLDLNPSADIIINIPDITVPNFEEHKIVSATSFNWSQLLKSKESFNSLWQLYLAFVDVFLILNFINLCENKYNRMFGGDTSQYEYYTVEESYTINDNTGEATNHRLNERRTTRKKVS